MDTLDFPHHIDEPPTLLIWRLDDMIPVVVALIAGILIGHLTVALIGGVALSHSYRKFRDRQPDGYVLHLLYWIGMMPMSAKTTPNPFARRWVP